MNIVKSAAVLATACALSTPALAGDFDGSKPLICANVVAHDCVRGDECSRGLPDEVGAPAFIRIDFEGKAIIGPQRTTPILFTENTEAQLLIQGRELGYAWAFALDPTSGRFSASLTNLEGTFVLFGSCTTL